MRYFVEFSYNGSNYHGWQVQPNATSVQQVLNNAFSVILRQPIDLMGAGRTDAGVHAKQMYGHFDCEDLHGVEKLIFKLNSFLPDDIAIHSIFQVHDDAHARFDAASRQYEYYLHIKKNVFATNLSWYYVKQLDVALMNSAAELLIGKHDFQCFSKTHTEVNNYFCNVKKALWNEVDDKLIFTIEADRFLRNMVRAIVGTLLNVGLQKISLIQFQQIIESKDRGNAGVSVPAHGLFLTEIKYPFIK